MPKKAAAKKAAKATSPRTKATPGAKCKAVDVAAFLAQLEHPHKAEIMALRQILLAADPSIQEAIKWNAPSFCTHEFFATFHLRAKAGVQIILHFGAKKRESESARLKIVDPEGLLHWLADDRATLLFSDMQAIEKHQSAVTKLIAQWICYV